MDNRFQEPLVKSELMKLFTDSPRATGRTAIGNFIVYNNQSVNFEVFLGKQKEEPNTPEYRIVFRFSDILEAYEFCKLLIDIGSPDWQPGEKIRIDSSIKDPLSGEMQPGPSLAAGVSDKDQQAYIAVHEHDKPTCIFRFPSKKKNKFIRKSGEAASVIDASRNEIKTLGELLSKKLASLIKSTSIDVQPKQPVRSFSAGVDDDAFI